MKVELNRLYRPDEFLSKSEWAIFLSHEFNTFWLETEICIKEPKYCVPCSGRKYNTYLYECCGLNHPDPLDFVTYDELSNIVPPGVFRGTGDYRRLYVEEVWEDYGNDGHIWYKLDGYRFVVE